MLHSFISALSLVKLLTPVRDGLILSLHDLAQDSTTPQLACITGNDEGLGEDRIHEQRAGGDLVAQLLKCSLALLSPNEFVTFLHLLLGEYREAWQWQQSPE